MSTSNKISFPRASLSDVAKQTGPQQSCHDNHRRNFSCRLREPNTDKRFLKTVSSQTSTNTPTEGFKVFDAWHRILLFLHVINHTRIVLITEQLSWYSPQQKPMLVFQETSLQSCVGNKHLKLSKLSQMYTFTSQKLIFSLLSGIWTTR